MAPHSSTLAWKIPWPEEPSRLQSMGLQRVGHDWVTSLSLFTFMHWRRKWQPTPVFLPGESQGQGSLVGCHLWGRRVGHDWRDLAAAVYLEQTLFLNTPLPRGPPNTSRPTSFSCASLYCVFFTNWGFMGVFYRLKFYGSPHQASLSAPFFQQHLFTLCLCVTFGNSCNVSVIFIIFLFVMVICDQWSLMLLLEFGVWAP